eukprot:CAMPEP_0201160982 /NCGR_PEP_ID=MMETSP0851-20130426/45979_1 /ASSEMBLY_ACC=CAM_ASM_000631 /TAXON_ID=183588 /ORGANISM="Pseudo-nitzschia fraudulenta, Strain WWA7" /LENGTH=41 /DNA_ID= /DNA_START= /DNA_END= /DNA_ORIENTATION=
MTSRSTTDKRTINPELLLINPEKRKSLVNKRMSELTSRNRS